MEKSIESMIKSNMRPYQKSAVQYRLHGGFFSFDHNNNTGKYRILGLDDTDRGTSYLLKIAAVDLPDRFAPTLNTGDGSSELKKTRTASTVAEEAGMRMFLCFFSGWRIAIMPN